ncbi:MAG: sulfatase-like hydrolase/transferase [Thermoanaerobaculia bacterium]
MISSRRIWIFAVALLVVVVGAWSFLWRRTPLTVNRSQAAIYRKANILLITLDTTRADHLGCYGDTRAETPRLDRLAREGILFEHCITPTAYTLPSHSSIMTGTYPPYHGVRINGNAGLAEANVTMAERLRQDGYRTGGFVGAFVLDGRWGLNQGFDRYDDDFQIGADQRLDLAGVQRPANQVVDAALKWLDEPGPKPFFAWVHLYDAHTPYEPPEPFRSRFTSDDPSSLYDGEIAFVDSQVGRLLDALSARGLAKDTIVVVVGDHGEGLGSHGESEHGYFIYDYAVHVPLLVHLPSNGSGGKRVAAQVSTVDIFPTILEFLGDEPVKSVQGESFASLIDGGEPAAPRYAYSESVATKLQYGWSGLYSIRTNDYKYIEAPRAELYDLRSDPDEKANHLDDQRRVAHELRATLTTMRTKIEEGAPEAAEANLDAETMAKLSSLGYLGGGSARTEDESKLADPKDKLVLYEGVGYAAQLIFRNEYTEASEVLQKVLSEDPDVPQAQILLASVYRKTKEIGKAKAILDRYLKRDPGNPQALISMAEILSDEGRDDDVIAICRTALARDEKNARAWELMADVYISRNDHTAALPLLRKVVEIQPKLTRSRNNLAACLIGTGHLDEAERILTDIISEYPKFPLAHYHLALLREQQKRFVEATAAYHAEIEAQPKEMVARFNLAELLFRLGDRAGAESVIRVVVDNDPEHGARPPLMLARVLLDQPGRVAEAAKYARLGLERAKDHEMKALAWFLLADIDSRNGDKAALDEALRQARYHQAFLHSTTGTAGANLEE